MISNMYYPALEFFGYWSIRYIYRLIDQKWNFFINTPYNTSCKTMQNFETIYSGPVFNIHWKYAYILNVCFITALFGPGMPVLFPIGLLSLIVLYITERLMIAYSY